MLFSIDFAGDVLVGAVGKRGALYWGAQTLLNLLRCKTDRDFLKRHARTTVKEVAMKRTAQHGLVMKLVTDADFKKLIKKSKLENVEAIRGCFDSGEFYVNVCRRGTYCYLTKCSKEYKGAQNFFSWLENFKTELVLEEEARVVPQQQQQQPTAPYSPTPPAEIRRTLADSSPFYSPASPFYSPASPAYVPPADAAPSPAYSPSEEALYMRESSPICCSSRPDSTGPDEPYGASRSPPLQHLLAAAAAAAAAEHPSRAVRSPCHPPPASFDGRPYSPSRPHYSPSPCVVPEEPLDLSRGGGGEAAPVESGGFTMWFDSFPPTKMFVFHGRESYTYEKKN